MNIPFLACPKATHNPHHSLQTLNLRSHLTKPSAMLLKLVVKQLLEIKPSTSSFNHGVLAETIKSLL